MSAKLKRGDKVQIAADAGTYHDGRKAFVDEDQYGDGNIWVTVIHKADFYHVNVHPSRVRLVMTREQINAAIDRGE